jgi:hypothetical protein
MIPTFFELPRILFLVIVFIAIVAIEILAVAAIGFVLKTNLVPQGPAWIVFAVTLGMAAWLLTLGLYLFSFGRADIPRVDATQSVGRNEPRYMPSEVAYKHILWALIALAVTGEDSSEKKIEWIEALHAQWIEIGQGRFFTQLLNKSFGRDDLAKIARIFRLNGPHRIVDILAKNKIALTASDREILVKWCFLLATLDGPVSSIEASLILDIASAVDISLGRLLNF